MTIINRITARLQLTAAYEGTKVKDLARYIKGFVPGARLFMDSSMMAGPGRKDPGVKTGILTVQQAHELGRKLIADGWYGRKASKKILPKQDLDRRNMGKPGANDIQVRHFIYYVPSSENGVEYKSLGMPYIKLMKPTPGDDRVPIEFGQITQASLRERKFMREMGRRFGGSGPASRSPRGVPRSAYGTGGFGW